ncbi:hypothetical protein GCM10018962_38640 [Dactylosporangium matsuzakiense]
MLDALPEQGPVGQPGQRVVECEVTQFGLAGAQPALGLLAAGDVLAQRQGGRGDLGHGPVAGAGQGADEHGQQDGDDDAAGECQ